MVTVLLKYIKSFTPLNHKFKYIFHLICTYTNIYEVSLWQKNLIFQNCNCKLNQFFCYAIFQQEYSKEDYYLVIPYSSFILKDLSLGERNKSIFLSKCKNKITTAEQALSYNNDMTSSQLLTILKHQKDRKYDSDV